MQKKTFQTFQTMMKKMTSNENSTQKQITIRRKTKQRETKLQMRKKNKNRNDFNPCLFIDNVFNNLKIV